MRYMTEQKCAAWAIEQRVSKTLCRNRSTDESYSYQGGNNVLRVSHCTENG